MLSVILAVVALCVMAQNAVLFAQMRSLVAESQRLLASRNLTEFSVSEARIAKATDERKPDADVGYASAWDSEDNDNG